MTAEHVHEVQLADGSRARISPVSECDAVSLVTYLEELAGETDFLTFGPGESGLTVEQQMIYISGLKEGVGGFLFKAEIAGQLAGIASIRRNPRPRIEHLGELGLGISRRHWGVGLGRALCQVVFDEARRLGIWKIELRVRADNLHARRLYEKCGFLVEGTAARAFRVHEQYFDEVLMGIWLGDPA